MLNPRAKTIRAIHIAAYSSIFSVALVTTPDPAWANPTPCTVGQICYSDNGVTVSANKVIPGESRTHAAKPKPKPASPPAPKPAPPKKVDRDEDHIHCSVFCYDDRTVTCDPYCLPKIVARPTPPPPPTPPKKQTPVPPQLVEVVKELPLAKPVLVTQPRGEALLNMPQIAFTPSPSTQTLHTELFGQQVTVVTHVIDYAWKWGDGEITHSHDPGQAYPHETVTHLYPQPGKYDLTLTITIEATYTGPDGVQQPIPGTTTLTSPPQHLLVKQKHTALVTNPGEGN